MPRNMNTDSPGRLMGLLQFRAAPCAGRIIGHGDHGTYVSQSYATRSIASQVMEITRKKSESIYI
jgi:hypothetical protein